MKKKLLYIGLGILAVVAVFVGYHYVRFLQATSRMKELSADLERRIQEWEKKEYKRPPLFGPAVPGDAATFYREAIKEKIEYPDDINNTLYGCIYEHKPLEPKLIEWAKLYVARIDLLKKGANAETYKPMVHPRDDSKLLKLATAQEIVSSVMVILGKDLENNNQFPEAAELYCISIRFGDDYRFNGSLIQTLIGIANSANGQGNVKRLLLDDKLNEEELGKLIGYLKILIDFYPSLQNAWESEMVFIEVLLKDASGKSGFIPVKDRAIDTWVNRASLVAWWEEAISVFNDIAKTVAGPYAQVKDKLKQIEESYQTSPWSGGITRCYYKQMFLDAERKGIYILAALKLYKLRHGAYPETLDKLAPAVIPQVSLDPFSDQPFIYRVDKETLYLYSVGENLTDDGGADENRQDILISPKPE